MRLIILAIALSLMPVVVLAKTTHPPGQRTWQAILCGGDATGSCQPTKK